MAEHKLVDGVKVELTSQEIAQRKAEEQAWLAGAVDRAIAGLRQKRNALIASSDLCSRTSKFPNLVSMLVSS